MKYEIWMEGFHAQGSEPIKASLWTTVEANSFQEACDETFKGHDLYDSKNLALWACRLFDNETDARKFFG